MTNVFEDMLDVMFDIDDMVTVMTYTEKDTGLIIEGVPVMLVRPRQEEAVGSAGFNTVLPTASIRTSAIPEVNENAILSTPSLRFLITTVGTDTQKYTWELGLRALS